MGSCRSVRWGMCCVAVAGLALVPACSSSFDVLTAPPPPEGVTLPILSEIALIVDAQVNGQATRVLLDTGTVLTSMASPGAIDRLGLEAAGANPFAGAEDGGVGICGSGAATLDPTRYTARSLNLGGVVFENVALTVLNETDYDTFAETGVDLILAAQFLMYTDWKIEEGGRQLVLLPLNSRQRPAGAMDMRATGPISFAPLLDAKIGAMSVAVSYNDAAPLDSGLDTGASVLFAVSDQAASQDGWDPATLPHVDLQVFGAGADCPETLFRGTRVKLGEQAYDRPLVLEIQGSGATALVGWPFFTSHDSVYVAPGGQWIEFVKSATTDALVAEPLRWFEATLFFNADGKYEVGAVVDGSSAAQQGVVAGDIVLEIDGVSLDTVEGKSLLFGPTPAREGHVDFLIQDSSGATRTVTLTAQVRLE
ncbi:MAG TPA: aspartyl protease family protein [Phycisphaerae bacterium]|nr:aspartyl protease family protein [Phycisphaerae bacterium]